jgi:hypothetical protein
MQRSIHTKILEEDETTSFLLAVLQEFLTTEEFTFSALLEGALQLKKNLYKDVFKEGHSKT